MQETMGYNTMSENNITVVVTILQNDKKVYTGIVPTRRETKG